MAAQVLCWQQLPFGEHFLCAETCAVGEVGIVSKVAWLRRRDVRLSQGPTSLGTFDFTPVLSQSTV